MATPADVRRIARSLDGTVEAKADFAFSVLVKGKAEKYAWSWKERVHPKKARVPNLGVLAIRTASLDDKEFLLRSAPDRFFSEPHYDGFPVVLLRLAAVNGRELRSILTEAWRVHAPTTSPAKGPRGIRPR